MRAPAAISSRRSHLVHASWRSIRPALGIDLTRLDDIDASHRQPEIVAMKLKDKQLPPRKDVPLKRSQEVLRHLLDVELLVRSDCLLEERNFEIDTTKIDARRDGHWVVHLGRHVVSLSAKPCPLALEGCCANGARLDGVGRVEDGSEDVATLDEDVLRARPLLRVDDESIAEIELRRAFDDEVLAVAARASAAIVATTSAAIVSFLISTTIVCRGRRYPPARGRRGRRLLLRRRLLAIC